MRQVAVEGSCDFSLFIFYQQNSESSGLKAASPHREDERRVISLHHRHRLSVDGRWSFRTSARLWQLVHVTSLQTDFSWRKGRKVSHLTSKLWFSFNSSDSVYMQIFSFILNFFNSLLEQVEAATCVYPNTLNTWISAPAVASVTTVHHDDCDTFSFFSKQHANSPETSHCVLSRINNHLIQLN